MCDVQVEQVLSQGTTCTDGTSSAVDGELKNDALDTSSALF